MTARKGARRSRGRPVKVLKKGEGEKPISQRPKPKLRPRKSK